MDNNSDNEGVEEILNEYQFKEEPQPLTGFAYFKAWITQFPVTAFCIFLSIILFLLVNYSTQFENTQYQEYVREYLAYMKYGAVLGGPAQQFLWQGQLWRLLVNVFHHGGVLHIFFNLYALYFLGTFAEKFMKRIPYLIFIVLCGIGQGIVCQLTIEPGAIGISGVIFGIFGILMIVKDQNSAIKRLMTPSFIKSMIIQLFIFMVITYFDLINIANVGHVFGFLYGFLFAFSFYKKPNILKKVVFIILNLSMIPGLYYVYKPVNNPEWQKWHNEGSPHMNSKGEIENR